ncbi:SGNH/GDSL hydrolase family protein [Candidatus Uabimicrobium amorphum]|uniref:SGNH hydrolase-type esterase domain-containing protein n=1 Tax=Uabimicrobium amorphum TaxID=2596890 RepID=A0A5S9F242_UABAM|nr:SGNH/GDSL hydrolase family protein [Candidatus Uabimicrobium amorphum]BBM81994.1 hypothetical protein UABAM_00337 [Candidatus Uabimicrobium amorphum]
MKKKFLLAFTSFIVFFLLCEALTYAVVFLGIRPKYYVSDIVENYPKYSWNMYSGPLLQRKKNSYIFWGALFNNPNKVTINKYGLRGPTIAKPKKDKTLRIMFLGGSHVFDLAAPENKDWPNMVATYLKTNQKIEIINAGMPGKSSHDNLARYYLDLHTWKPDILVFSGAWNDIRHFHNISPESSIIQLHAYDTLPSSPSALVYNYNTLDYIFGWSLFYSKLRHNYYSSKSFFETKRQKAKKLHDTFSKFAVEQYKFNLEMLYHACKITNSKLVLLKQSRLPHRNNGKVEKSKINYHARFLTHKALCKAFDLCDQVMDTLQEKYDDIEVIETSHLCGKVDYFYDAVHTSSLGSQKIAQVVAKNLQTFLQDDENF